MNLVGQAAGYLSARQPAPRPPKGGGPMHGPGMLSPLQFAKNSIGMTAGHLPTGTVPWGEGGGATGGGVAPLLEEAAPLAV